MVSLHWRCGGPARYQSRDYAMSRPAHSQCRRAQRRSRMARLRATAPAARSVLDGREHGGTPVASGNRSTPIRPSKSAHASPSKTEITLRYEATMEHHSGATRPTAEPNRSKRFTVGVRIPGRLPLHALSSEEERRSYKPKGEISKFSARTIMRL